MRCYVCNEFLPQSYTVRLGEPMPDAWSMVNVAPHAASGGSMEPMHRRCAEGKYLCVAQPGSAPDLESGGRRFESGRTDQCPVADCAFGHAHYSGQHPCQRNWAGDPQAQRDYLRGCRLITAGERQS